MAALTLVATGAALAIWSGDGSSPVARGAPTTTSTTITASPTRARDTKAIATPSTTFPTPSTTVAAARSEPQWYCADHGVPSPHYVATRAPTDHVCTDSELAADPPAWSASSSAVTQSYWSCWDTGRPRPHHLGHDAPGDHLCSDRELAQPDT